MIQRTGGRTGKPVRSGVETTVSGKSSEGMMFCIERNNPRHGYRHAPARQNGEQLQHTRHIRPISDITDRPWSVRARWAWGRSARVRGIARGGAWRGPIARIPCLPARPIRDRDRGARREPSPRTTRYNATRGVERRLTRETAHATRQGISINTLCDDYFSRPA